MKWSLRGKILSGYGLILLFLIILLLTSLVNLQRLGRATGAILRENYKSIISAEYMIDSIERQDSAILLILLGYSEEGRLQFTESIAPFMQWLGRAKDNITIVGEEELVNAIEKDYLKYLNVYESLITSMENDPGKARQYYHETVLPFFKKVRDNCHNLRELNQNTMYASSEEAQRTAYRTTIRLLATGLSVLVLGLFFSLFLSRIIVQPLVRVMEGIRAIEKGNYDVEISSRSSDELGHLSADFNRMVKQLKRYRELNIGEIMAEKKKIETIIRSIDAGIVVVDTEARVTDINTNASEILGVKESDIKGNHFLELLGNEEIFQQLKRALEKGIHFPGPGEENSLTIEEEEDRRYYQFFITPISLRPGQIQGAVLLLRDITQLKELNELKSEFIMKASHELKNPLTGLAMSISLLKEADLSRLKESERQLILNAEEDLARLKTIVSDLLDLSKIEAGKLPMEITEVSIGFIINKAVEMMKPQADKASISLSAEYPEDLSPVQADVNKILWVLTNLISNALRYTEGKGFIKITAGDSGPYVQVNVQDNGRGISYENQARIFDKFFQVKETPGESGSLGIGLAICKEIVKAHGGIIWVESTPGEGSTFSFTLHHTKGTSSKRMKT